MYIFIKRAEYYSVICISEDLIPVCKIVFLNYLEEIFFINFLYLFRFFIKNVCQMLVMLGTSVYQDDFERHFLKVSAEFYKVCKL